MILSSLRGFWQVIASSTLASSTSGAAPFPLGPFNHILCVSGQSNCKEIKKPITKTTINDRDIKPRQTTASKGTACFYRERYIPKTILFHLHREILHKNLRNTVLLCVSGQSNCKEIKKNQ